MSEPSLFVQLDLLATAVYHWQHIHPSCMLANSIFQLAIRLRHLIHRRSIETPRRTGIEGTYTACRACSQLQCKRIKIWCGTTTATLAVTVQPIDKKSTVQVAGKYCLENTIAMPRPFRGRSPASQVMSLLALN